MLRVGLAGLLAVVCTNTFAQTPSKIDFTRDIEPLLEKRCFQCHGPQQQMSNLRFDRKESAMRVIQPGNAAASRLIRMVSGAEAKVMPPVGARLTTAEIATLKAWVDQGAAWSASGTPATHWSFVKVQRPD